MLCSGAAWGALSLDSLATISTSHHVLPPHYTSFWSEVCNFSKLSWVQGPLPHTVGSRIKQLQHQLHTIILEEDPVEPFTRRRELLSSWYSYLDLLGAEYSVVEALEAISEHWQLLLDYYGLPTM